MTCPRPKPGLTRLEVVVILLGLLLLAALLLPAIQITGRHTSGRQACLNNLNCVVLALQSYRDYHGTFPMGVVHAGPSPGSEPPSDATLGPSWWFGVLPFAEQRTIYDQVMRTQRPGGPERHAFCADDMIAAGIPLPGCMPEFMRCPSSPLPFNETAVGPILLPSYVGIAGGCDIDPDSSDFAADLEERDQSGRRVLRRMTPQLERSSMRYRNKFKGTGVTANGIVTSSGMLPPCRHVGFQDCSDGTSNVMIIAEQSDWLRDQDRTVSREYHGDSGWTVERTGSGGGFLSGTGRADPVPRVATPGGPAVPWAADCWNI